MHLMCHRMQSLLFQYTFWSCLVLMKDLKVQNCWNLTSTGGSTEGAKSLPADGLPAPWSSEVSNLQKCVAFGVQMRQPVGASRRLPPSICTSSRAQSPGMGLNWLVIQVPWLPAGCLARQNHRVQSMMDILKGLSDVPESICTFHP